MLTPALSAYAAPIDRSEDPYALGYSDSRKIVRDSYGKLYVAYRKKYKQLRLTTYHIFVAKSADGGSTWAVANANRPIESVGDFQQRVPSIAIDSNDVLHVAWYGNDAANSGANQRQIKYVRSSDGGNTWSPWQNIAPVDGYAGEDLWQEHPTIAVDGADKLYVVWQGKDPAHRGASQAKFSASSDGGSSWSAWANVAPSSHNRSRPTLATTPGDATLYMLAYGGAGTNQQIMWTRSTDGGASWAPWAAVAADSNDQRHVSLAVDSGGRLHAVWRQIPAGSASGRPQILYAHFDGKAWSRPQLVQSHSARCQFFPSVAETGNGTLWVVWTESPDQAGFPGEKPTSGQIIAVSKPAGGSWGAHTTLATSGADVFASLRWGRHNNGGTVDVVWLSNTPTATKDILYTSLGGW